MLGRVVSSRLDMPRDRVPLLVFFVIIAIVQYSANALARTAAEGLFLANAGPQSVPLYLIIVGLVAVPTAGAISRLIDRVSKVTLFRATLLIAVAGAALLRGLVATGFMAAWFAVLIGIVLLEMLLNIQFWVLIAEYFTSLEQKRLITLLTVTIALGGTLGGAMANILAQTIPTADLLLVFPLLYLVVFFLARRLHSERALDGESVERGESQGLGASLKSLPQLIAEYPLIAMMAIVGFLDVLLGGVGSYLAYTVYADNFPDEQRLTQFLGTLRATLCIAEVVLVTLVTRPLIARFGVGRMNVLYPLTSFVSLIGLGIKPGVPTAVVASVNFDGASASLNAPVENLTYNAVPPRFLGRVRSISEGILQPAGLTGGGLLLVAVQGSLSFRQVALMAISIGALHVILGWWRGRTYLNALTSQLSSRSIDLVAADGARAKVPPAYAEEVARLLASEEAGTRAFGVELAARLGTRRFLPAVKPVLAGLEGLGRRAAVDYLRALIKMKAQGDVVALLDSNETRVQTLALEALLATEQSVPEARLQELLLSEDATLRGLARVVLIRQAPAGTGAALLSVDPGLGDQGLAAVTRGARAAADPRFVPVLVEAMVRGTPLTRATAIEGLAEVAPLDKNHGAVLDLVEIELGNDTPQVRCAAYALLAKEGKRYLNHLALGLEDTHAMVRSRVVELLASFEDDAIPLIAAALHSQRPEVADSALSALGRIRNQAATETALEFLEADYRSVQRVLQWQERLPSDGNERWQPLLVALEDANRRTVDKVLRVLAAFGHGRILRHARQVLRSGDRRLRANAVEALSSISHRQFVLPVLQVLEALAGEGADRRSHGGTVDFEELFVADDRWVRVGAAEVARALGHSLPERIYSDPDPVVRATAAHVSSPGEEPTEETVMSRLLFLKSVNLFSALSLDELLALDGAMRQVDYLKGETIFDEGSLGEDFFLITAGEVSVRTGASAAGRELARLEPGDFFGEMALFDDEPRSAACLAATPCVLLALDRNRFYSLIEQLPQLGIAISRELSQRLRRTEKELRQARQDATRS